MLRTPYSRLAAFLLLAAVALFLTGPVAGLARVSGPAGGAWFGAIFSVFLIGATILCARLNRENPADLGFAFSRRRLVELCLGFLTGALLFAGAALIQGRSVGGSWRLNAVPGPGGALGGLLLVLCLFLSEELLFRGYAFQQLVRILGPWAALALSAALFGVYHLVGSGDWGMGAALRFLMPALGGAVFGYALLRSGSLALPIGLHWGGNWVQSLVFGLGHESPGSSAIWIMPLSPEHTATLTSPDVWTHLPYLTAMGLMLVLVHVVVSRRPVPAWERS